MIEGENSGNVEAREIRPCGRSGESDLDRHPTLTPELARDLAREFVPPVDAFGVAGVYCMYLDGLYRIVFGTDGGRRNSAPVGPGWASPRDASMLIRAITRRESIPDLAAHEI